MTLPIIIFIILTLATVLNCALIGLIVMKSWRLRLSQVLVLQMLGIVGWTVSIAINIWLESLVVEKFIFAFAALALLAQFWFAILFPDQEALTMTKKALLAISTLIGGSFVIISFIPDTVFTAISITEAGYTIVSPGPLSGLYALFVVTSILGAIIALGVRRYYTPVGRVRSQATYLMYSFIIFFIVNLLTNSVLPVVFEIYFFNAIGPVFSVILIAAIVYIIMQHQFLEIREIAQRGLIYTILFILVAALYSSTLIFSTTFFPEVFLLSEFLSGMLVIGIALITVPRIDRYLRKLTDPIFFKDGYDYRRTLHELSAILQSSLDMESLVNACEDKLAAVLRASTVNVTSKTESARDSELQIPIRLQEKLTGLIMVGPKKSGEPYTDQDKQLLETFANQAATAMSRVLLYQEVKRRAEELEVKVQERTQELQTLQEKQKAMMLQLSHNLQTPLAVLQTKIEDLHDMEGMEDTATGLTRSLQYVSAFIKDLLRFARLESNQIEFQMETIDVSNLIEELVEEVTIIADEHAITVTCDAPPNVIINGDANRLREVFMNLASNAIKYMRTDSDRHIAFALSVTDDCAICTLTDTGIGLTKDQQTKIFDRFYRAGESGADGTGLGLAVSKRIIESHNGTITVTSEQGVGSTFTITLPLATN